MNKNSELIVALCSHLCIPSDAKPFEPSEWSALANKLMQKKIEPFELFEYSQKDLVANLEVDDLQAQRMMRLLDRMGSMGFELSKYENAGISIITRADEKYPKKLKKALGNSCPPLFYCAGNIELLNTKTIGYVGSRTINDDDMNFTRKIIEKTIGNGYSIVSGGAKGIDSVAEECGIEFGAGVVEYLSDSLTKKLRVAPIVKAVQNGKLLLLSVVKPDASFNAGVAMMRNRYIYAQSTATVVVKSDYNKGGTWNGAIENLKHSWCSELCWNNKDYKGNQELISRGAIPIDDDWDGNPEGMEQGNGLPKQINMFD